MSRPKKDIVVQSTTGGTLQDKAYDYVKEKIMKRGLAPGQNVTDAQIANELNMSRTPVRGALLRLDQEGFLVSNAGKGWKIYSLSLEDIKDIFDIKLQLEGMICRKAAASDDKKMRGLLKATLKNMKKAFESYDLTAWQTADMELHNTIFAMSANQRAARIIKDLNDQWYRVQIGLVALEGRMQRSITEHEAIVESILANDEENADINMRRHLTNLREELVRVLVNLVFPFAQNGI